MRIAITGGIAEGKSTVLGYLRDLGYRTANADAFARDVFAEPSVQGLLADLLQEEQPIEPHLLRVAIAASVEVRRAVNRIMHGGIADRIASSDAQFIEVPLLIETSLHTSFDQVWVVTCGPVEQIHRLLERYGASKASELVATQLSAFAKIPFADVVVRTNLEFRTVQRYVEHTAKQAVVSDCAL